MHRFDIAFSPLVLSIAESFDFYVTDTPVMYQNSLILELFG